MVSSKNRTALIFFVVLVLLLVMASICVIAGYMLISPLIKEQLSDATGNMAGNISGKRLAYITVPADSSVRVVDPSVKRVVATVRFNEPPSLAIPGTGGDLYVAAGKSLYILDIGDLKIIRNITYPGTLRNIVSSPDGSQVYVEYESVDGVTISVLDTSDYVSIGTITDMPGSRDNDTVMSPDGKYLYVTGYDISTSAWSLEVIDAGSGVRLKSTPIAPDPKYMRITPDGRYLYICFENDPVEVVNTQTFWVEGNLGFIGNSVEFSR
jgi:DNA-binding beta-propeller fold protein YncE